MLSTDTTWHVPLNRKSRESTTQDTIITSRRQEQGPVVRRTRDRHPDTQRSYRRRRKDTTSSRLVVSALFASTLPVSYGQSCIALSKSAQCAAFNASSISTGTDLVGLFPFLSNVTDASSFDQGIQTYIAQNYATTKYQQLLGCSSFQSSNTTDFYARYTTSVLCNAIVQNSITPCGLSGSAATPICADTCSQFAQSEAQIAASSTCGSAGTDAADQIRADFTNCALPANSLSGSCIEGASNEPDNCGYSTNLEGLCTYCAASSPNATDSCCVFSNTTTRCSGVKLAVVASSAVSSLFSTTTSPTSTPTGSSAASSGSKAHSPGLTGGQIAGIVIGSILGAFLLLALLILACILLRRRKRSSPASSIFNQPGQARQGAPMALPAHDGAGRSQQDMTEALPGGRITCMTALEGAHDPNARDSALLAGGLAKYPDSSADETTPEVQRSRGIGAPQRTASLNSNSILGAGGGEDGSPGDGLSSPDGTGQSEQLDFFRDYYSQDDIRPGDLVSTLWAYQPRAHDEFELERGDMLKITGIWDDGWATGIRIRRHAEDWRPRSRINRDSGMSNGGNGSGDSSPELDGSVKAFPLVCVCLPQHWRKTIEGDSTEETTT